MKECLVIVAALAMVGHADAHSWYSDKHDPKTGGRCCGGSECAQLVIEPGVLTPVAEGYRIRLTVEQAKRINSHRNLPLDTVVPWNRIQDSDDGNFHMCIPNIRGPAMLLDMICFFAPSNS